MNIVSRGTAVPSTPGTDRQSCAFPQTAVLPDGRWLVGCRAACTKGGNPEQTVRKDGMADAWSEMGKFSVGLPATVPLSNGDFLVAYYAGPSTDCTSVEWARVGR